MNLTSVYDRKKYQRAFNRIIRDLNANIQNDWLWNGRFVVRQRAAWFNPFEDHSGARFEALLVCTDTKTGKQETKLFDNFDIDHRFFWWVNECITERFNVWAEDPDPREQARLAGRQPT